MTLGVSSPSALVGVATPPPADERPLPVRLSRAEIRHRINGPVGIEFGPEQLTSYSGLEVFSRFVRRLDLRPRLRGLGEKLRFGGDAGFSSTVLLLVAMLLVGARRLAHVAYLSDDPVVLRFAGLKRTPDRSTLGRWLKRFNYRRNEAIEQLNRDLAWESAGELELARLTVDVDGSVLSTGLQVQGAMRGFNPHRRKSPSYYPITAMLAQTGHVIAHKNRPGNVHDSTGAGRFMEELIRDLRRRVPSRKVIIEFRPDGAFFQREVFEVWDRQGVEYALKVPMMPWLGIKARIAREAPRAWETVDRGSRVEGFFMDLPVEVWDRTERVAVYRKLVGHKARKSKQVQLDLFHPDDGEWEYSVVATNKSLGLAALWHYYNGRSGHEKVYAELKDGYAYAAIPTNHYSANTAWQKLNIFAYNLTTSLQLATGAEVRPRSRKRTAGFVLRSIKTLRFTWLNRAARFLRPRGKAILRLADNAATKGAFARLTSALPLRY